MTQDLPIANTGNVLSFYPTHLHPSSSFCIHRKAAEFGGEIFWGLSHSRIKKLRKWNDGITSVSCVAPEAGFEPRCFSSATLWTEEEEKASGQRSCVLDRLSDRVYQVIKKTAPLVESSTAVVLENCQLLGHWRNTLGMGLDVLMRGYSDAPSHGLLDCRHCAEV